MDSRRQSFAFTLFFFILGITTICSGIVVDGDNSDWEETNSLSYIDAKDDALREGPDIISTDVTHDANTLYVMIKYNSPYPVLAPDVRFFFDLDGDSETGFRYLGAGIDSTWEIESEEGEWSFLEQQDLGRGSFLLRSAYNAQTGIGEYAFPLTLIPGSGPNKTIAIAFQDGDSLDRAPEFGESALSYKFNGPARIIQPSRSFAKKHPDDLRIMAWNVLRDAPMNSSLEGRFGNILQATQPDIIAFQEMYEASTPWALAFVERWLPSGEDAQWYARKVFDCITVSRYPIIATEFVDRNLVTVIDTTSVLGQISWLLNAHTPCCSDVSGRLEETDNFMSVLRGDMEAARSNNEEPFAIFLTGDMNTGGSSREMLTMVEGLIFNTVSNGETFSPDWDGSGLTDAAPLHTHSYRIDTWRSLSNRTNTSRLDYIFYSDSQVFNARSFTIDTRYIPSEFLESNGILAADTDGSDHLPVVADFRSLRARAPFGNKTMEGTGWIFQTWMGDVFYEEFPYLYTTQWAWLYQATTTPEKGHWFYSFDEGWLWIHEDYIPWYFSNSEQGWLLYNDAGS